MPFVHRRKAWQPRELQATPEERLAGGSGTDQTEPTAPRKLATPAGYQSAPAGHST